MWFDRVFYKVLVLCVWSVVLRCCFFLVFVVYQRVFLIFGGGMNRWQDRWIDGESDEYQYSFVQGGN